MISGKTFDRLPGLAKGVESQVGVNAELARSLLRLAPNAERDELAERALNQAFGHAKAALDSKPGQALFLGMTHGAGLTQ